jgi:uncharacterized protein (DUF488 family)
MPVERTRRIRTVATVGYENATPAGLTDALSAARVDLLVDVRALAGSRKPGFAKSRLSATLADAGIEYLHLPSLGTPRDGRIAARAGRTGDFRRIMRSQLRSTSGREGLATLAEKVGSGRRVCLLCLEADPEQCHRSIVAEALGQMVPIRVRHLRLD